MESRVSVEFRGHLPKRGKHHANSHIDNGGRPSLEATPFVATFCITFDIHSKTCGYATFQKHHRKHRVGDSFRNHGDQGPSIHDEKQMDDARCMEDYNVSLL
jgi:hypothetical protein